MSTRSLPRFHLQGGAGFYTSDLSNKERLFEVRPEKILVLECLGPPESDWNLQSFQVPPPTRNCSSRYPDFLLSFVLFVCRSIDSAA